MFISITCNDLEYVYLTYRTCFNSLGIIRHRLDNVDVCTSQSFNMALNKTKQWTNTTIQIDNTHIIYAHVQYTYNSTSMCSVEAPRYT